MAFDLSELFDTSDFPARWHCGNWTALHGWTHIISDLLIAAAYVAIPMVLVYFLRRRPDVPYPRLLLLFSAFIISCGMVHAIEAVIFWLPLYRVSAVLKVSTAVVSLATVFALIPAAPRLLRRPSARDLEREVARRSAIADELRNTQAKLEALVSRRERQLAVSEQRYEQLFERLPVSVIAVDRSGRIQLVNAQAEEVLGYRREELVGEPLEVLVPLDLREAHESHRAGFLTAPAPRTMGTGRELHAVTKGGQLVPVEVGLNPMPSDGGGVEVIASLVDISERVRAEEELARYTAELERSNRELDRFAYVASHDLKAPLRGLHRISQWIEDDLPEALLTEDMRENLGLMRSRTARMTSLLEGLLAFARVGREAHEPEPVALSELVRESLDLLGVPADAPITIADDLPTLHTVRVPLQHALQNLLSNAMVHGEALTSGLSIDWEPAGRLVEVVITDRGPGIAPEHHDRIFQAFETMAPRDVVEASGIGLAIVKKIVEQNGGSIWIESEVGAGASFHFTWPIEGNATPVGASGAITVPRGDAE